MIKEDSIHYVMNRIISCLESDEINENVSFYALCGTLASLISMHPTPDIAKQVAISTIEQIMAQHEEIKK